MLKNVLKKENCQKCQLQGKIPLSLSSFYTSPPPLSSTVVLPSSQSSSELISESLLSSPTNSPTVTIQSLQPIPIESIPIQQQKSTTSDYNKNSLITSSLIRSSNDKSSIIETEIITSNSSNITKLENHNIIMTQDELHLDQSQPSSMSSSSSHIINQRSIDSIDNQITIDDNIIITSPTTSKEITGDEKFNITSQYTQNTELEKENNNCTINKNYHTTATSSVRRSGSNSSCTTNFVCADINNDIRGSETVNISDETKEKHQSHQIKANHNDNIILPTVVDRGNKIDNDDISIKAKLLSHSEKQNEVQQLNHENLKPCRTIFDKNSSNSSFCKQQKQIHEDCLMPNNTNEIFEESTTATIKSNSDLNELKQIENKISFNETVVPAVLKQNNNNLQKQPQKLFNNRTQNPTIINKLNETKFEHFRKNLKETNYENEVINEVDINNKELQQNNKLNLKENNILNKNNESSSDCTTSEIHLLNNENLASFNINDNSNAIIKSDKNNSELNLIKQDKNQKELINAKKNDVNENKKQAQGVINQQDKQQLQNNLNFNESITNTRPLIITNTNNSTIPTATTIIDSATSTSASTTLTPTKSNNNNNNEIDSSNNKNKLDDVGISDNNEDLNNKNDSNRGIKYKYTKQKTLSQDEDPIVRLNRLRENITNALREVKGVIRQYSSEQSIDIEDNLLKNNHRTSTTITANKRRQLREKKIVNELEIDQEKVKEEEEEMAPIADNNKPIEFRYVRKIRRNSNNLNEEKHKIDEQSIKFNADNNNRNNLETNELSQEKFFKISNENLINNNNINSNSIQNIKINENNNNLNKNVNIQDEKVNNNRIVLENKFNEDKNKERLNTQEEKKDANNNVRTDIIEKLESSETLNKKIKKQTDTEKEAQSDKNTNIKKECVKKLIIKNPSVKNRNSTINSEDKNCIIKDAIKPKIKKIKKVNSLDKDIDCSDQINNNEQLKQRPKLRKQTSFDENLVKDKLSKTNSEGITELLKETEVIPVLELTSLVINKNSKDLITNHTNLNNKNSSNTLNKFNQEKIPFRTDINLVNNKNSGNNNNNNTNNNNKNKTLIKSDDNTNTLNSNETSSNKSSDEFTILLSREVIISKVVVPQGSIEFDNPELIQFDKSDNNNNRNRDLSNETTTLKPPIEIELNLQNSTRKPKTVQRMTISENPVKIDRRASVATTDTKKLEGEYKQQLNANVKTTMPQRRLSENVKIEPIVKLQPTKIKSSNQNLPAKTKTELHIEPYIETKPIEIKQNTIIIPNTTTLVPPKKSPIHSIGNDIKTKEQVNNSIKNKSETIKETQVKDISQQIEPLNKDGTTVKKTVKSVSAKSAAGVKTVGQKHIPIQNNNVEVKETTTKEAKTAIPKSAVAVLETSDSISPKVTSLVDKDLQKDKIQSKDTKNIEIKRNEITKTNLNSSNLQNNKSSTEKTVHIETSQIATTATKTLPQNEIVQKKESTESSSIKKENLKNYEIKVITAEVANIGKNQIQKVISKPELKKEIIEYKALPSEPLKVNQHSIIQPISQKIIKIPDQIKSTEEVGENITEDLKIIREVIQDIKQSSASINVPSSSQETQTTEKTDETAGIESNLLESNKVKHESSHSENETTEDEHFESESTAETTDTDSTATGTDHKKTKTVKKRKAFKKVVIKKIKRRLSVSDGPPRPISPTSAEAQQEPEVCEKEIYAEDKLNKSDLEEKMEEEEEEEIILKPKPCIRPRAFEPDEPVLYGERYKKTQIKWRKAIVVERITSISYKIHFNDEEENKTVHLSYLKRDTGKKISFGGKEYLEIDYAQIEEEEEKYNRPYSIWDRA